MLSSFRAHLHFDAGLSHGSIDFNRKNGLPND